MFRGSHNLTLDVKGRIMLPVRVRELVQELSGGQMYITTHNEDPCLLIYPTPHYLEVEEKILTLPNIDSPSNRNLQRFLVGNAREVEIDATGRLLIPPLLREYQNLEKQLVLAGSGKKLELWNQATWMERFDEWRNAQRKKSAKQLEELEEKNEPIEFSL